jgi:hypothetical protein
MRVLRRLAALMLLAGSGNLMAAASPDDPYLHSSGSWAQPFDDQWALENLRVYTEVAQTPQDAAAATGSESAVIVAVVDTGMDYRHPDFAAARLWRNSGETRNGFDDDNNGLVDDLIGWNFVDNDNNPWDLSGHGTHISGIIAACTNNGFGIAAVDPEAVIMPLKVANFVGQARSSSVAAAIYYAVDQGARIINLSLGGELVTDLERAAALYATDRNVLIVVSAGNRGLNTQHSGYASLPGVLVVGASDISGERAGFSNFGTDLAVLAPGVDVLSLRAKDTDFIALTNPPAYTPGDAFVGESDDFYIASGTSFSAAMVSGMASRLLRARPALSAAELKRIITQSAVDIGADGVDQTSGYGRVDFVRALAAAPGDFIAARLTGVDLSLADEAVWIAVQGDADAAEFGGAELMVRAAQDSVAAPEPDAGKPKKKKKHKKGEPPPVSPFDWQPFGAGIDAPVNAGELGRMDLQTLAAKTAGATAWELRLVVTDQSGAERTSMMSIALPVPTEAVAQEVGND